MRGGSVGVRFAPDGEGRTNAGRPTTLHGASPYEGAGWRRDRANAVPAAFLVKATMPGRYVAIFAVNVAMSKGSPRSCDCAIAFARSVSPMPYDGSVASSDGSSVVGVSPDSCRKVLNSLPGP